MKFTGFFSFMMLMSVVLMACSKEDLPQEENENKDADKVALSSELHNFYVDTLATGLRNPWGIAFLPDGRMLVTERAGDILIVANDQLTEQKLSGVPQVYANGQGGLLDIKLHPDFESNQFVYLSYSEPGQGGGSTAIMRAKLDGNALTDGKVLFSATPKTNAGVHFGSRIVLDGQGYLYFTIGDRGNWDNAQNLTNHSGKVLRIRDDGRVPMDNPFVENTTAKPEIWTYGNRNPQGLAMHPVTGQLWSHEHGPRGGDELNMIEKGNNYGWPVITYGINYNGQVISPLKEKEGMEQPVKYWDPSPAFCGMTFYSEDAFSDWKNNIFMGALSHKYVLRVEVDGDKFVKEEKLLEGVGRVRAVEQGRDGFIYVLTEGPGLLLRLRPASN